MTVVYDKSSILAGTDDGGGNGNQTMRQTLPPGTLSAAAGNQGQLVFLWGASEPTESNVCTGVWIGQAATAPAYTGNQVQVFFGGSASFSGSAGGVITSDIFTLGENWDNTKTYMVSWFFTNGSSTHLSIATLTGSTLYGALSLNIPGQTAGTNFGVLSSNSAAFVEKLFITAVSAGGAPLTIPFINKPLMGRVPPFGLQRPLPQPAIITPSSSPVVFRKTLSQIGGRIGSRQPQGWDN